MKSLIVLSLLGLCMLPAASQDSKSKLATLEGRWNITTLVVGGQPFPEKGRPTEFLIKGGKASLLTEGKEIPDFRALPLRPHVGKNSNAIDIFRDDDSYIPCIYELEGDTFKLAMPLSPEKPEPGFLLPRPESFDSKDKPVMVFTMTKTKN